jgi:hypothetical protein
MMSRSGYVDDMEDNWALIRWRGAVNSAVRGKRGQAFLKEMLAALDALPERKLIANDLVSEDGCVCALGAVGKARGMEMEKIDPYDRDTVAECFDLPRSLAFEIMDINDDWFRETPEHRFERVYEWVKRQIHGLETK